MLQRPMEDSLRKDISTDSFTVSCMKLRINAKDKTTPAKDNAKAYGNKFIIPLDFEMLDS